MVKLHGFSRASQPVLQNSALGTKVPKGQGPDTSSKLWPIRAMSPDVAPLLHLCKVMGMEGPLIIDPGTPGGSKVAHIKSRISASN